MTRWCILRTSGGQTLPLARSLGRAGFDVWTPARTIRKVLRQGTHTEQRSEVDVPILPTFVFARDRDLASLADLAVQRVSPHCAFSIFRHGGRIPLVGDREVAGLRREEERAAATMQAMRDADTHQEAERIRIAAIKSESARRRATKEMERERLVALRSKRCELLPGATVEVAEMSAFAGVVGVVETTDGSFAKVRFGSLSWKIEAWRLSPSASDFDSVPRGLAA